MNTITFPNMFDINNGKLSTNLSYNIKSIHESLTSLILTSPGELLGDPAYGCNVKTKLFDIKSDIDISEIKQILFKAISKYLPQIVINQNNIKIFYNKDDNKYKIVIPYTTNTSVENQIYELIL